VTSPGGHEVTRAAFEVMLALGAGAAHGYGVMQYVARLTDGAEIIPAGTLYRTLAILVADGWVEETGSISPDAPHDARRRYYRLTELGRSVAAEEAKHMDKLVVAAREAGLLVEGDE
jgi:DNA-binding PadR family transcriptional regulator